MKKSKIALITLLLATLVVGCSKDEPATPQGNEPAKAPLRIFANQYEGNGSKVSFDPTGNGTVPFAASWVAGEKVVLNGTEYTVAHSVNWDYNYYLINGDNYNNPDDNDFVISPGVAMTAIYPGPSTADIDVEVSSNEITLNKLLIRFLSDGSQSTAFPMVATAAANVQNLYFNHLTAGVQLTLRNGTGSAVNVAKLTIIAQSGSQVVNLSKDGVTARWAVEGPWVPVGPVGQNGDDVDVKYSSVMNFDIKGEGTNYKTIAASEYLKFCVPITISSLNKIKVIGYDQNGTVVFYKKKSFGSEFNVDINKMYTLPEIVL